MGREGLGGPRGEEAGPFPQGLALSSPDMKQEGSRLRFHLQVGPAYQHQVLWSMGTVQTPLSSSAISVFVTFLGPGSWLGDLCSSCALCPLVSFLFPPIPFSVRS